MQDHHGRNSFQDHHNRRSPRCNRRSPTPYRYKVTHFSLFQDHSPTNEGQLYTDKAPDGHRAFHTTLQLVTRQGPKPLKVKVNPGADASIIPLSRYRSLFPHHFHTNSTLRSRSLRKTNTTWSAHDGTTHNFFGFFTIDVQHKTKADVISFYIFKDSTRPFTLLSYAASIHLGIIEFKVPNEANSHTIDSIKTKKKKISFSTPLCYSTPTKSTQKMSQKLKPALKLNTTDNITSQDHRSQVHSFQDHSPSSQDHCTPDYLKNDAFQDHVSSQDHFPIPKHTENYTFQDHLSVKDV